MTPTPAAAPGIPSTYDEWLDAYGAGRERDAEFVTLSGQEIRSV